MRNATWLLSVLGLILCCSGGPWDDPGDSPSDVQAAETADRLERGQRLYTSYCTACHGKHARGDGLVAPALLKQPADLTRLALRNDGTWDAASVASFVDGRNRVPAHGSQEMPVWGRRFDDRNENILDDETRLAPGSILLIVEYLGSLQVD